jgi:hypothetical protein
MFPDHIKGDFGMLLFEHIVLTLDMMKTPSYIFRSCSEKFQGGADKQIPAWRKFAKMLPKVPTEGAHMASTTASYLRIPIITRSPVKHPIT